MTPPPAAALVALLVGAGCARPVHPFRPVTQAEWDTGRATLAAARAELPGRPYSLVVRVELRDPTTGRTFSSRGALAVAPGRALRLQLLGPGGATALDAWLSSDRFRFEVPAAGVRRSGRVDGPEADGLPVGFFRFWFLRQVEGRLLFARPLGGGTYLVLRDGDATVEMFRAHRGGKVLAERTRGGRAEELLVDARGPLPTAGDRAAYRGPSGLRALVFVEAVGEEAPDPAAFEEPAP